MPQRTNAKRHAPIPALAGIGLRHPHIQQFLDAPPEIGWLEVHSENYLGAGGPRMAAIETIRRDFSLSCHGVRPIARQRRGPR